MFRWARRIFKLTWNLVVVAIILLSLAMNVASLAGGAIYSVASGIYETATGRASLAGKHSREMKSLERRLAVATNDLATERATAKTLRAELRSTTKGLATERMAAAKLREEVSNSAKRLAVSREKRLAMSVAASETADRISLRSLKAAARNVGSMSGKGIPWIGATVIVGATALEIRDLCATMKDMAALKQAFDPGAKEDPNVRKVCGTQLPTKEQIWLSVREAPGVAWDTAKEVVPSMEDIRSIELPNIDYAAYWSSLQRGASGFWDTTKGAAASAGSSIMHTGSDAAKKAKEWIPWIGDDAVQDPEHSGSNQ